MNRSAECGHCRRLFEVDAKFTGGLVPCPGCGKVVEVPGTRDPLWSALKVVGLAAAIAAGAYVWDLQGPAYGIGTSIMVLVGLWASSRCL